MKKKYWLIILAAIILLLGGGWYYLSKNSSQEIPAAKGNDFVPISISAPSDKLENEENDCPYNEHNMTTLCKYHFGHASKEELTKWKQIPSDFITNCWKKGYHWLDIIQLWDWKIVAKDLPDLKAPARIGVINQLFVMPNPLFYDDSISKEQKIKIAETAYFVGRTKNLVIIVKKTFPDGPRINISRYCKPDEKYVSKIINFTLGQENINPQSCQIFVIPCIGAENFGQEAEVNFGNSHGNSNGGAIYLALLSALREKPISKRLAATGRISVGRKKCFINEQEIQLDEGSHLPIASLEEKVASCVEKGINRLVLSKYQSSPHLLAFQDKTESGEKWGKPLDNYQSVVPTEIKEKIQVYWAENVKELRKLLDELN